MDTVAGNRGHCKKAFPLQKRCVRDVIVRVAHGKLMHSVMFAEEEEGSETGIVGDAKYAPLGRYRGLKREKSNLSPQGTDIDLQSVIHSQFLPAGEVRLYVRRWGVASCPPVDTTQYYLCVCPSLTFHILPLDLPIIMVQIAIASSVAQPS